MCLGVPGKVIQLDEINPLKVGKVDFSGTVRKVSFSLIPDARVGDWVIVHVGFAIAKLEEREALEQLKLLREVLRYEPSG
jgi:hydrogenase expression/formation protein HypC